MLLNNQHQHCYNTRFKNNLLYPRHRLTLFENTPLYMGKRFYNKLPNYIKNEVSEDKFKILLKEFLIEKAYYSIQDKC